MYTLLVYEEVPENLRMFLIPSDVAEKYRSFLEQAHGHYINSDDMNDGMNFLCAALTTHEHKEICNVAGYEEHMCCLVDYEQNGDKPINA